MFLAWTFVGWAWVSFGWVKDCQPLINELLAPFVVNQCGVANWPTATVNRGDDLDFHVCKMPTSKWVGVNPVKFESGVTILGVSGHRDHVIGDGGERFVIGHDARFLIVKTNFHLFVVDQPKEIVQRPPTR